MLIDKIKCTAAVPGGFLHVGGYPVDLDGHLFDLATSRLVGFAFHRRDDDVRQIVIDARLMHLDHLQ